MCIQSGELVIISRLKRYIRIRVFKSLRLYITVLLMLVGIIPCLVLKGLVLKSYETRAVEVRTAEIQNQCTILCSQLSNSNYQDNGISDIIQSELTQLANVYHGRIMVIDNDFCIMSDTDDKDVGRKVVAESVVKCFRGDKAFCYDRDNRFIEVTAPIRVSEDSEITGVVLVSVSTDTIAATKALLAKKANIAELAIILIVVIAAIFLGTIMVRPFARITRSIGDLQDGYDADYLHVYTYKETTLISDAFNQMLGRLKKLDDSRQEFVSNVSHELKTPLTSMKVLSDSLLSQEEVPVELYREFMGDLSEEIERENKIINDLLSLVKMDKTAATMNIRSENINELIEKILKRLQPLASEANVEVVYESFRPVTAEVDEVKLSLAISNLVENAIKYNRENGWVHVSLNADHKYVYIEVADSGIGIPETETEHIFERFYRVDKSHSREIGGSGLGLSIARNAVVMHRGAIKVFSQPGEGTTFSVRIPINYAG